MTRARRSAAGRPPRLAASRLAPPALAGLLGVIAALLVACGSSSDKLIPLANAGPLSSDVEAIEQAAKSGDGDCGETEAAIAKAERDFAALPASVDAGLRNTLHQGIANLRTRALALCAQPLPTSTSSTAAKTTATQQTAATTPTAPATTPTSTTTATTPPASTTPTTPTPGGGTPAPGGEAPPEAGGEQGAGASGGAAGGGASGGGAGAEQGAGGGAPAGSAGGGAQEGAK